MFGKRSKKRSEDDLRKKFIRLGVDDLEFCIEDELDAQANPRLAPLVLFHNIWQGAIRKGDTDWITETINHFEARKALEGVAATMWSEEQELIDALRAITESNIDLKHITTLARRSQEHLLYHVAYTLSDSHSDEVEFEDVNWGLFETDEEDNPIRKMNVLHEYYGLVDPDRLPEE